MCKPIKCLKCKKISFIGCGKHLDAIFTGKKKKDLCLCNQKVVEWLKSKGLWKANNLDTLENFC